ncbi:electron transfer flavoprotein-ubiquinone oxidoreductase [Corallincola spongiicola]|uniref:Electron transfer flavoprotein-ubiquinone oxidoreductase n=1 Tax=Corallincola spongiicola TaxID=2520508 RepID=A0ABY1WT24_9GAMM|nr:electron transfer flavoprotein-ubiquinone oxidoreductase [Corallincola spongiicola]TAA47893.1 electron transfer flavoprotein-ubiquinone oxidoreductase [Corallincola spongiicola]
MQREQMSFDLLIVGAGPAGLSAAIRAKQLQPEMNICVLEKGPEVGAHILSGAVFDPIALQELFPGELWRQAPLGLSVNQDQLLRLSQTASKLMPEWTVPKALHNDGCKILSLGKLCRWLAEQAQALGVDIFPGFSAHQLKYEGEQVVGVITGDMGRDKQGELKPGGMLGMEILAPYTLLAEGCRGHLGKQVVNRFALDAGKDPQHYALGFKEVWRVSKDKHQPGLTQHTFGWPLTEGSGHKANGGGFIYHGENQQVYLGLIVDLNYQNPHLDPFEEFQQFKRHPMFNHLLAEGERLSYGARTIAKGGWHSLPKMSFPGGMLIGCDAGTLDAARIKGSHTAMKSGMLAAEAIAAAATKGAAEATANTATDHPITDFDSRVENSWLGRSLYCHRNSVANLHRFGLLAGGALNWLEQNLLNGHLFWHSRDQSHDHEHMLTAADAPPINYPKPDKTITFSRTASLFLSNLNHDHDQPNHLQLTDDSIPINVNLSRYNEPAQRYCPAGVYEVQQIDGKTNFVINSQNCLHCKCCDIKDPSQNIQWVTPEGGSGPQYTDM